MRALPRLLLGGTFAAAALALPAGAQSFVNAPGQIPSGNGNSSSTEGVDFADIDGDGDFDAVFGDGGDDGNDRNRIWINQGGLQGGTIGFFVDDTGARFPTGQDTSRDIDFVDYDNDGDDDLYISNTSTQQNQGNRFWTNQGGVQGGTAGFFVDETATRWVNIAVNNGTTTFSSVPNNLAITSGLWAGAFVDWSCDCVFGDLDNDGDVDLVHTTYGGIFGGSVPSRLFLNDGVGNFEEFNPSGFQLSGTNINNGDPAIWAQGTHQHGTQMTDGSQADVADTPLGVEIGDIDGDWDIDILQGARNEQPRIYVNPLSQDGVLARFRDVTYARFSQFAVGGGNYEQELGDFDNDNDLDIYGLNWASGAGSDAVMLNLTGAGSYGPYTVLGGSGADDNDGDFFDYDNDGDLDIFVCNFSGQDKLYRNSGAPNYTYSNVTSSELPNSSATGLAADSCDVDLDGDYDLLVGNDNFAANKLLKNVTQEPDLTAGRVVLEQVADGAGAKAVRARVYDNSSWDVLRYHTTQIVYTVDGGSQQVADMIHVGGQMFRGVIPAPSGCDVDYFVRSTDEHGNTGVSGTLSFMASCSGSVNYCTAGTTASGCQATLSTSGTPSASAPSGFDLMASGVEGAKDGLFFYGSNGRQANVWGNGTSFQCVVPPVRRAGLLTATGTTGLCDGSFTQDLNARWTAKPSHNPGAGTVTQAQLWFRDPMNTSNQTTSLSDAIEFTLAP